MADFGFGNLSDTDDSAVDDLISQTKDLCVLEQVSKINCSSFNDSLLPSDLETRFRKLKSFPASATRPAAANADSPTDSATKAKSLSNSKSDLHNHRRSVPDEKTERLSEDGRVKTEQDKAIGDSGEGLSENPNEGGKGSDEKSKRGYVSSPSDSSSNSCIEDILFSEEKSETKKNKTSNSILKPKSKPFVGSPLGFSNSSRDQSPSPPRKPGCFWCSPKKKTVRTKSKENWEFDWGSSYGGDELLSDLGTFSVKEQQKILKKAMKEEERVNREADKIVKWAKQASSRMMSYHGNEQDFDGLSDDDDHHVTGK